MEKRHPTFLDDERIRAAFGAWLQYRLEFRAILIRKNGTSFIHSLLIAGFGRAPNQFQLRGHHKRLRTGTKRISKASCTSQQRRHRYTVACSVVPVSLQ